MTSDMGSKKAPASGLPVSFLENHHKNYIAPKKPNMTAENHQHLARFPGRAAREQVINAYLRTFKSLPETVISPAESGTSE